MAIGNVRRSRGFIQVIGGPAMLWITSTKTPKPHQLADNLARCRAHVVFHVCPCVIRAPKCLEIDLREFVGNKFWQKRVSQPLAFDELAS